MSTATKQTLEQKIQSAGNPVDMLRNSQVGPYVFPISSEFSNWRDEQEAWQKTAVLFDLSYHMTDIYFEGPGRLPAAVSYRRKQLQEFRTEQSEAVCGMQL